LVVVMVVIVIIA